MLKILETAGRFHFYNGKPAEELPPFNTESVKDDIPETSPQYRYLNGSLYFKFEGGKIGKAAHVSGIAKAIERLIYIDSGLAGTMGGYATTDDNGFVCEYWDGQAASFDVNRTMENDRKIAFKFDDKMNLSAAVIERVGTVQNYDLYKIMTAPMHTKQTDRHSLSPMVFALTAWMLHSGRDESDAGKTLRAHYENLMDCWNQVIDQFGQPELTDELRTHLRVVENDVYAILKMEAPAGFTVADFSGYGADVLDKMNPVTVKQDTLVGTLVSMQSGKTMRKKTPSAVKTVGDYANSGEFVLDPLRVLTVEEASLVPELGAFVPDEDIVIKAKLIKKSSLMPKPFRNVMWIGETGTGKSTAARILAQMMHLPYVFLTVNPDTIVSDLYVNILPNTNKGRREIDKQSIKLIEDAVFDPETAYAELTGQTKTGVTTEEIVRMILEKAADSSNDFVSVESPLVRAFRYGWVCELQEVNYAMKPGVLGGINAALDDIAVIQLPTTGEVIHRHPDTVIVMTANDGYEGTKKINQAVKSRMCLKGHFSLPDDDALARRAAQDSGFKDMKTIKKMIAVMHSIRRILAENGETNGSCSFRELQNWCQATEILGDPYMAAMSTIIPSASDDPEVIAEVISGGLEEHFSQKY